MSSLNIKSKEAHRLAAKLAKATGESMTKAVTQALKERLERVSTESAEVAPEEMAMKWVAIGKEIASRLKEPYKSMDHADLLYDEMGLPK
jgi:antitoxin VapB